MGDAKSPTRPAKLHAKVRRQIALEMRIRGAILREIAEHLDMTTSGVHRSLQIAHAELVESNHAATEQLRELINTRLDIMLDAIWDRVIDGDLAAVREARKIEADRARLLGLVLNPKTNDSANFNIERVNLIVARARGKLDKVIEARLEAPKPIEGK